MLLAISAHFSFLLLAHFLFQHCIILLDLLFQIVPCAVLTTFAHPTTSHNVVNRLCWAFCVYLEAVSVLPQLRLMQNTKVNLQTYMGPWLSMQLLYLSDFSFRSTPFCRLLSHSQLIMCLHWVWHGFLAVHTGSFRFVSFFHLSPFFSFIKELPC
jgi:hypothetical protein